MNFHDNGFQITARLLTTILAIHTFVTIILCYVCAVVVQHRLGYFPTISETGDYSPEAAIFSFGLSISAFILSVFVSLIHLLHCHYVAMIGEITFDNSEIKAELKRQNRMNTIYGFLASISFIGVATFRSVELPTVHYVVASLLFASSWSFMLGTTMITQNIRQYLPEKVSAVAVKWKWTVVGFGTAAVIGLGSNFVLYQLTQIKIYWNLFAISEYLLLGCFTVFCFSFWNNFQRYSLNLKLLYDSGEEPALVRMAPTPEMERIRRAPPSYSEATLPLLSISSPTSVDSTIVIVPSKSVSV